jgi:class 3 adenylate cyclase
VRGTPESMKNLTNMDERSKKYTKLLDFNNQRGYETFVFASKKISQLETETIYQAYQMAFRSSIDKEKNLALIAEKLESNLVFEGAVGLLKKFKPYAKQTVEQTRMMGLRTHILSGDYLEACKRTAMALKMISGSNNIIEVNFTDAQGGRAQINKVLELITKKMAMSKPGMTIANLAANHRDISANIDAELFGAKNFVLCIPGVASEVARSHRWIREHLKLILEFSITVIGYDMNCSQKALMVQLFTELGRKTIAVGDGMNDILMLKAASVGVQVQTPGVTFVFGDITIQHLGMISGCLNLRGRQLNNNLNLVLESCYQHSLMMVVLNIIFQLYTGSTGVPILSSGFLLLIGLILVPVNLIFIMVTQTYDPALRAKFPQLYAEKKALNDQIHTKSFLKRIILPSVIEGSFLGLLTIECLYNQTASTGELLNQDDLKLTICVLVIFLYSAKLLIFSQVRKLQFAILLTALLGISLSIIGVSQTVVNVIPILALFKSFNQITLLLLFPAVMFGFNWQIWEFTHQKKLFPIGEYLNKCINYRASESGQVSNPPGQTYLMTEPVLGEYSRQRAASIQSIAMGEFGPLTKQLELFESQNLEKLLGNLISTDSFSTIFKNCFHADSEVSEQVMKLLFPSEEAGDGMDALKKSLTFKSRSVAKKFAVYAFDKFIVMSTLTLAMISVCLATYLLADGVLNQNINWELFWPRIIAFVLVVSLYSFTFIPKFARKTGIYSVLLLGLFVIGTLFYSALTESDYALAGVLMLAYLSTQFVIGYKVFLVWCIITTIGFALNYVANFKEITIITVLDRAPSVPIFRICCLFCGLLIVYLFERYHNELLIKKEFLSGASLEGTNLYAKELLGLLLPKFILEEMENAFEITTKPKVIDDGVNVSILFCDIAEFDEVVRSQENSIIGLLDGIFKKFDDLCTIHGVQKIETVGKTYMAAAGLKKADDALPYDLVKLHPTQRVLNLSKEMMTYIHEHTSLDLKIGIHVGKPVMGVIGFHKPQFSLIGDVVNTTSRHCTTGKKGRVMMSQAAWETVELLNPLAHGYAKEVVPTEMKGKGSVLVYQLYHSKKRLVQHIERIIARKIEMRGAESIAQVQIIEKLMNKLKKQKSSMMNFADIVLQVKPMDTLKNAFIKLGPMNVKKAGVKQSPYRSTTSKQDQPSLVSGNLTQGDGRGHLSQDPPSKGP